MSTLAPILPQLDPSGQIAQEVSCFQCGYNLHTKHLESDCPECGTRVWLTLNTYNAIRDRSLLYFPPWHRLGYLFFGIALPVLCFLLSAAYAPLGATWQSGNFNEQVALLLGGRASWVFYPLLIYSIVCMGLILARPIGFGRFAVIRFGIYSGLVLSLQYSVLQSIVVGWLGPMVVVVVGHVLADRLGLGHLYRNLRVVPVAVVPVRARATCDCRL